MKLIQSWINNVNNKKGISSLEIVIGILIFLIVFCFLLDLLILIQKVSVVAQTNTQIARIVGIQGGALHSPPNSYPGGYVTINELNNMVKRKFNAAGIKNTEWEAKIGYGRIGKNGVSPARYDYKEDFSTVFKIDYRWDFMSNILPGSLKHTITSKRPTMSEWKYNYSDWEGE